MVQKYSEKATSVTTQQPRKFLFLKQSITWKQAIRFFIEYGTVARLGERTEQSYARSVTDPNLPKK